MNKLLAWMNAELRPLPTNYLICIYTGQFTPAIENNILQDIYIDICQSNISLYDAIYTNEDVWWINYLPECMRNYVL